MFSFDRYFIDDRSVGVNKRGMFNGLVHETIALVPADRRNAHAKVILFFIDFADPIGHAKLIKQFLDSFIAGVEENFFVMDTLYKCVQNLIKWCFLEEFFLECRDQLSHDLFWIFHAAEF